MKYKEEEDCYIVTLEHIDQNTREAFEMKIAVEHQFDDLIYAALKARAKALQEAREAWVTMYDRIVREFPELEIDDSGLGTYCWITQKLKLTKKSKPKSSD